MGETSPQAKSPFGADWKEAFLGIHLGRPLLGQRVHDLLSLIAALGDEARDGISLNATGDAALIALHAAALEPRIIGLNVHYMTTSWSDVAKSTVTRDQLANVVPGALAYYDLPDLAALAAPRPMLIRGVVDPAGRPVSQERIETTYATTEEAYSRNERSRLKPSSRAGPSDALSLGPDRGPRRRRDADRRALQRQDRDRQAHRRGRTSRPDPRRRSARRRSRLRSTVSRCRSARATTTCRSRSPAFRSIARSPEGIARTAGTIPGVWRRTHESGSGPRARPGSTRRASSIPPASAGSPRARRWPTSQPMWMAAKSRR